MKQYYCENCHTLSPLTSCVLGFDEEKYKHTEELKKKRELRQKELIQEQTKDQAVWNFYKGLPDKIKAQIAPPRNPAEYGWLYSEAFCWSSPCIESFNFIKCPICKQLLYYKEQLPETSIPNFEKKGV